ncbi:von Willebrand factor type A domain prot [Rhodobacteraceae bacterium KLH11]|nr:von Willebrand factor type A domain prot [Rhodobacteraceae bacterium KLH11]
MIRWLGALGLALTGGPLWAEQCRLALALAMDISTSVNATEDALQRQGLAAALIAPEVQKAFFLSPQPVALAAYEWSGSFNQKLLLDWQVIRTTADLTAAAHRIGVSERSTNDSPTAMGHALAYGAALMQRAPRCLFQTIDISADGKNNDGYGPQIAYKHFPFSTTTVNGLVINASDFEGEVDLIPFFRDQVLHGPGAFLEVASGFDDFERAMRRKLERELKILELSEIWPRDLP